MKRISGKLSLLSDVSRIGLLVIPCNDSHVWVRWIRVIPLGRLVMAPLGLAGRISRVAISLIPMVPEIVPEHRLIYHGERLEEVMLILTSVC